MNPSAFRQLAESGPRLAWLPEIGLGYLPPPGGRLVSYDDAYFQKYVAYQGTAMGVALTQFRVNLVAEWAADASALDVGIGSGAFVAARANTWGYDVNPAAITWLEEHGRLGLLAPGRWAAVCFWDSLEHIEDWAPYLASAQSWVFVSSPCYSSAEHALVSRHYRPGEHLWYWTPQGLTHCMAAAGFERVAHLQTETQLGREDIHTMVFRRVQP